MKCQYCPASIFFIRHNGGCVWVDELGWPWPKHECYLANKAEETNPQSFSWISAHAQAERKLAIISATEKKHDQEVELFTLDSETIRVRLLKSVVLHPGQLVEIWNDNLSLTTATEPVIPIHVIDPKQDIAMPEDAEIDSRLPGRACNCSRCGSFYEDGFYHHHLTLCSGSLLRSAISQIKSQRKCRRCEKSIEDNFFAEHIELCSRVLSNDKRLSANAGGRNNASDLSVNEYARWVTQVAWSLTVGVTTPPERIKAAIQVALQELERFPNGVRRKVLHHFSELKWSPIRELAAPSAEIVLPSRKHPTRWGGGQI